MAQRDSEPSSGMSGEKLDPAVSKAGAESTPADEAAKPAEKVTYSMSPGLAAFLGANRIGLAISSYQSGKF